MTEVLSELPQLNQTFITAVDGRKLSPEEIDERFDLAKFNKNHRYAIKPAEIGCTLSHNACYQRLLADHEDYALILEDDVAIADISQLALLLPSIHEYLMSQEPRILLLSDWYWWKKKMEFGEKWELALVHDAMLAHAYLVNKAAAEILVTRKPAHIADHWYVMRDMGISISALYPPLIFQTGHFETSIQTGKSKHVRRVSIHVWLKSIKRLWSLRFMRLCRHYVAPRRIN